MAGSKGLALLKGLASGELFQWGSVLLVVYPSVWLIAGKLGGHNSESVRNRVVLGSRLGNLIPPCRLA